MDNHKLQGTKFHNHHNNLSYILRKKDILYKRGIHMILGRIIHILLTNQHFRHFFYLHLFKWYYFLKSQSFIFYAHPSFLFIII